MCAGRELHPIFYGCYDWHSCVHGYWLLARLLRVVPDLSLVLQIERQFDSAFTPQNIAAETAYFKVSRVPGFRTAIRLGVAAGALLRAVTAPG